MPTFDVNVRAIVKVTAADPDATGEISADWELYDWDTSEKDSSGNAVKSTLRCDQSVRVEADDAATCVENAKAAASDIAVAGYVVDEVTLWVDEDLDITPVPTPKL